MTAMGNIILRTVGSVHGVYSIGFWSYIHTHCRMEIQCCRPTNWPVYRLDQGPKLCNCSPTRGLHGHDGFQIIGDISTLRVLSQVKHMLNQSYIYSRLKIPLYIPGSIKTHRIYTRDFIHPAHIYYEALWHDSSLLKRFNSNNAYALYLTRFTYDIMFGCYKQKQRYVFWYEKWQKNIFQWGIPVNDCRNVWRGLKSIRLIFKKNYVSQKFHAKNHPEANP